MSRMIRLVPPALLAAALMAAVGHAGAQQGTMSAPAALAPTPPQAEQQRASPQPQHLGRLFMTPEIRSALERQRQLNIQEAQTLEGSTVTLNGVVTRSSGRRTVWINGQAQHDEATPSGVAAATGPRTPGRAVLTAGEEHPTELEVGETVNRATREKTDGLAGGQVSVNKGRSPARR
ncbi:MAG: hypothetical protein EG825_06250 [Rhodocyclaceae bacterium]|nr:hypothetical protein [Rhodocyclaceae bacterium]